MAKRKKKDTLKEAVDRIWPKTKKELEKGIASAKKLIRKSEKYIKEMSEKGVKQTKKLSLGLKKEKLYYDLGKTVSSTPADNWKSSKKIDAIVKEIKALEKKIRSIKI